VLIGLASALLVLGNGRIAGISGIVGSLLEKLFKLGSARDRELAWRAAFVLGLILTPWLYRVLGLTPEIVVEASPATVAVAGLLVGVGTRLASGCTSGHGVCGISRGSRRSLIATLAFMASGFVTVLIVHHLIGA
jgi:uncharacterized protein